MKQLLLLAWMGGVAMGAGLEALPEYLRPDPFGGIVGVDGGGPGSFRNSIELAGARGGYVSFHLVVKIPEGGAYTLGLDYPGADLHREWFHLTEAGKNYYPDALIPVRAPYQSRLPEPDNRVERQTAQAFWVDIWIPFDARPGVLEGQATLEAGGTRRVLPIRVKVLPAVIPEQDVVTMDHNSYGSSWILERYQSDAFFARIHAYHRIFYEHRGVYHQLGYGHGGKVGPEFAPELAGSGRSKRVASWSLFDRHYGPLLDGSAFAGTRRGARPIPFVYLPINPEWPASFLWWGEPGYEAEFVNVVSEMERHFREKGWTRTRFELFFNHKKRYKAFPWDGDETRFPEDNRYFVEYARLLKKALPPETPVRFVFRTDASWMMEQQFKELAGVINFWVCGGTEFGWYDYAPRMLKQRGDIVWFYGGTPPVTQVSSAITTNPLRAWMWGVDGYVHWLAVSPGRDPWFRFDGGGTALVYPGERFGIQGPIPSLRLKLQRNAVQDITLLDSFKSKRPLEGLKAEAARLYNGSKPQEWWTPRPPLADLPSYEWTNSAIDEAPKPNQHLFARLDAAAFQKVHRFVMELAGEER
jgi:hypothetical protein